MPERIPKSTTVRVPLQAYLSSDHISPATGKTIAVTISKNGGAYGNPSGGATNATEIASGSYYVDLSTTDTGTLGPLFVLGTATATDNVVAIYDVVNANTGGLAALPDTAVSTNGSLHTQGSGTAQINASGGNVALTAAGLDAISVSDPGAPGSMTTLPKMMVGLWRWFFKKTTLTSTQLKTYADDGTTVNGTATVSDDGTTQTKGALS